MSFAIIRQPVFDIEGNIFGYEVYLRRTHDLKEYPKDIPYNKATFIIAELVGELGVKRISEGKKTIISVTLDSILNKTLDLLTIDRIVFKIIPPQVETGKTIYANALKRIEELKNRGGVVAITEQLYSPKYLELLEKASVVVFKANSIDEGKSSAVRRNNKKVLISNIESEKDYEEVKPLGDLFEGNYLGEPTLIKEFEIAPFLKATLMRMIATLNTAQSIKDFANVIASDVGMSAKLLRFVNSAYFSRRKEIKDLIQACAYLGMENLKKFTLLVATNDYVSVENPILWKKSLIRAILAEQLAKRKIPVLTNEAYLAGLFSLIDKILGVDKVEFLTEVNIDREIIDAYTGKNKDLSEVLREAIFLEEALEAGKEPLEKAVEDLAQRLGVMPFELNNWVMEAQEKAGEILRL